MVNEYEKLLAYLKIQYHNLSTLHRHLTGDPAWFSNHEQLGEWYALAAEQADDLVETGIALGYRDPGIKDAVLEFSGELLETVPRDRDETFRLALGIMRGIAGMMQSAEPNVPSSVANKLQEYEYIWNKEANYKLVRMLGAQGAGKGLELDDDD